MVVKVVLRRVEGQGGHLSHMPALYRAEIRASTEERLPESLEGDQGAWDIMAPDSGGAGPRWSEG